MSWREYTSVWRPLNRWLCRRHGHLVRRGLPLGASADDEWVWWCARCDEDLP